MSEYIHEDHKISFQTFFRMALLLIIHMKLKPPSK